MALSDLSSPSAVFSAIKELDRLGRERFLELYGFAAAREYLLLFEGREYDSKAIAGVAHRYEFPELGTLPPDSFSGGISAGGAAKKLTALGFDIVGVNRDPSDWTLRECELTTEAYFDCLTAHLKKQKINKAALYKSLAGKLNSRSGKAVEYKFQNISAILMEAGLPALGKPKGNYQSLLKAVVRDFVRAHAAVFEVVPDLPLARPVGELFVAAPLPKNQKEPKSGSHPKPRIIDFAKRDAENRRLGERGEHWVVECEKKRLIDGGRADLAETILWASKSLGDGLGYDIVSFTRTGEPVFIEVKTTNGAAACPFYISEAELTASQIHGQQYRLYRVFDFAGTPYIFELEGPLRHRLSLSVASYRAVVA